MTCEQQLDRALAYFTDEDHKASFEILNGTGSVMFSAPHAVLQTRNGTNKAAERYTGILCKILNEEYKYPVIYKTRHLMDDANYDEVSDYREALCRFLQRNTIRYLIDLHQLKPARKMDVCVGTGHGKNIFGKRELVDIVRDSFMPNGITNITVDDPFPADDPNSVCSTVTNCCDIPAIQLEINSNLLIQGSDGYRLSSVIKSLHELADKLNAIS